MKITVYNFKGGVGKTAISLGFALDQGYAVVTNDYHSPLEWVLKEESMIKLESNEPMPEFDQDINVIFDLGGKIDSRAISAIKQSDWVIIPTINKKSILHTTLQTINQVKDYNSNILVVVNQAIYKKKKVRIVAKEKKISKTSYKNTIVKDDLDEVAKVLKDIFPNIKLPIYALKKSNIFDKIMDEELSLKNISNKSPLLKSVYKPVLEQIQTITEFIHNNKG